jgi:hypothetical protein
LGRFHRARLHARIKMHRQGRVAVVEGNLGHGALSKSLHGRLFGCRAAPFVMSLRN